MRRKAMWRMRRARRSGGGGRKQGGPGGRIGGRRQRRLWQLPQSSIDEYTKWIQEKPEADQTPNEQRFLWKCMIRSLGIVGTNNNNNNNSSSSSDKAGNKRSRQERIRELVDRLGAKEPMQLTENEEQFLHLYHKRRKDRKQQRKKQQQEEQEEIVSWMRCSGNGDGDVGGANVNSGSSNRKTRGGKNPKNKNNKGGFEPSASLESLRESMNKMGLSSDKLKQVRFSDQPMNG